MVGGEEQDSGVRSQESEGQVPGVRFQVIGAKLGVRSQKPGDRMRSICFPPSAFWLLPTAYCI